MDIMWVSRKKYNDLLNEKNRLEYQLRCNYRDMRINIESEKFSVSQIDWLMNENKFLKLELEKYKELYADEVQKRLELIELYENK